MFKTRTELREAFHESVFERDDYRCKVCSEGSTQLFAHRINDWPNNSNGGFVLENGITLCIECKHEALALRRGAENPLWNFRPLPEFVAMYDPRFLRQPQHHPAQLYRLVRPVGPVRRFSGRKSFRSLAAALPSG